VNYSEQALGFACGQETLFGILALPEKPIALGVVVIVGGPQYRAGSHRQFVLLARALAAAGYPVLRFDYRGMGDSSGNPREFSTVSADVNAAIGAMQSKLPAVFRFVLWGLCDGASAALLYCHETNDARVAGLCLLNPWVRSEASLARAHVKHYYTDRLKQREFWLKLLSGKVAGAALAGLWRNLKLAFQRSAPTPSASPSLPFQAQMAAAWGKFHGNSLLVISGKDYTAKEFLEYSSADKAWEGVLHRPNVVRHDLPDADHTFSDPVTRAQVEVLTREWLQVCAAL
jgi:exosortase A-associated hydrolase 1